MKMTIAATHACALNSVPSAIVGAIFLIPIASFVFLLFFGKKLNGKWAGIVATGASSLSFLAVFITFLTFRGTCGDAPRVVTVHFFEWIKVAGFQVDAAFRVDALSVAMALFVTGIGSLIHLYSVSYMEGDPRYSQFFVYLNLFLASMLLLVLGNSLLLTFVGWEGVGTCSYLLISFWFERKSAATAGKKAFVVNRIGDFGFLLATFLIASKLLHSGSTHVLDYGVVLSSHSLSLLHGSATAICLLLLLAACGKSAQLPLHIWLPDAMEGPTPVSALIHAATMVTAGVYLLVRMSPLLNLTSTATTTVAIVGAATAFFAATIAVAQNDIKRVLAYSTISQLGYMFLAVGSGAYVAALFMMIVHAFYKALLFLGSGSVIHGVHNEQDMKKMGALRMLLPITSITFIIGWLAIIGIFPLSGFWAKDDVLHAAYGKSPVLWAVALVTAVFTAYYMTRQVILVFFGKPRFDEHHKPHESKWPMTVPLVVLAFLSVVGGVLNLPSSKILENWIGGLVPEAPHVDASALNLALIASVAAFVGVGIAYLAWRNTSEARYLEPRLLARGWFVDALYTNIVEKPGNLLANFSAYFFDSKVIDGAVNGTAELSQDFGSGLRRWQTGYLRTYVFSFTLGVVLLMGYGVTRVWSS
jgi:NADH-quinone oxidoreductase subunit L